MIKRLPIYLMLAITGLGTTSASYALEQNDGVYQIATGTDMVEFSKLVSEGNGSLQAVLTADIDMTGLDFAPIGNATTPFKGTFDGNCHYVQNLTIDTPDQDYVGLFGVVADGAHIKNVIVDASSYINGKNYCAGIAGGSNGGGTVTIENCGNEASVTASEANAAGIIGVSQGGSCSFIVTNCYNTGAITGNRESAAISGWVGGSSVITRCYNAGNIEGMDGSNSLYRNSCTVVGCYDVYGYQGTLVTFDQLQSGEAAYLLNENGNLSDWYQTLGEDTHPVPFSNHGTVYAVGNLNCDGSPVGGASGYSNTDESVRAPHTYVAGVCSECGDVDLTYMTADADGSFAISTADQLYWFAAYVGRVDAAASAYLTADIDFTSYTAQNVTIGKSDDAPFKGVFDGREHKVTVAYNGSSNNMALFAFINTAKISNLLVDGTINTSGCFAGGLLSVSRGASVIENCVSLVDITSSYAGDATHGGLASNTHNNIVFRNCGYAGQMDAPQSEGCAGIIGYAHGGTEILLQNVYVVSNMNISAASYDVFARKSPQFDNCFYWTPYFDSNYGTLLSGQEALGTGELCYLLNGNSAEGPWRQNLDTDEAPLPFASHSAVYVAGTENCDGTPASGASYSNESGLTARDDHDYVDGVCSRCGARHITTGEQLMKVADDVASGRASRAVSITLGADIDMNGIYDYPGIGTVDYPYAGKFDGNGHRIMNMTIDNDAEGNKGLFGVVTGGAKIKNVVIDATCYIYAKSWAAGVAGTAKGSGLVEIENCGNEAEVTVTGANAAGILGVNDLSGTMVYITNCYNVGTITGGRESAAISGWLGNRSVLTNCYNAGEIVADGVDGNKTFSRGDNTTFVNCYEQDGSQVTTVMANQVRDGELCWLLNGESSDSPVFFQTLGEDMHPVFDASHKVVYYDGTNYTNDNVSTAIEGVEGETGTTVEGVWSISGVKQQQLQKGINVVKMSDGNVRKVLVK